MPDESAAVEIVSNTGRKRAIHFGGAGRELFGFYHPPARAEGWRGAGIVLVNPIGTDQTRSDRTYRNLAERLAAAGFACLRFDLYGTGDSGGAGTEEGLVRRWVEDVGVAIDELRGLSGARSVGLVGLRLGATIACLHAAQRGDVETLVMWSPCVSGSGFVTEVTKLHKVYARIEPQLAAAPATPPGGEEALGMFLPRPLIDELAGVDLLQTSRRPAKRTLVIDGGGLQGREPLLDRLRGLGASPELRTHTGHKFLITVSHSALLPEEVIGSIVQWMSDAHPSVEPGTVEQRGGGAGPHGERPVVFGLGKSLFGLVTPANVARAREGRPAIVISNAGCVNRSGPHRISVRMARRWADLGFDVLRIDLSGIGDSPAAPGERENLTYPASGVDDIEQALRSLGRDRAIVAGLCSGGDYAFQLGARTPALAGAWMLNPRTFCVLDLAEVESGQGTPPTTTVEEVPRALRAMADRGVDAFLLVSKNDPGVSYVDGHAAKEMHALAGVKGFHREDIAGADHTFTPVAVQAQVIDCLTEHLVARFG
jgi:pimeloyl-ACP methyl ester carboxylesterase